VYGWLWRHLPGPWPARLLCCAVLAVIVVVVLFQLVFPWLDARLPFNQVTVSAAGHRWGTP
jgi:hypothetical protein